jgi:hypothetical protein
MAAQQNYTLLERAADHIGAPIRAFIFVLLNLNQLAGKKGKLSRILGVKTESLYYNARFKSMLMISRKLQVYFLSTRLF